MSAETQSPAPTETVTTPAAPVAPVAKAEPQPKAKAKARSKDEELIGFVSKDPGLEVLLGEGRNVKFDRGVAFVTPEIAAILEKNHLYAYDHISRADEVARINGKIVSFKGDPGFREQVAEAKASGKVLFFFDAKRGTTISLGDINVAFDNGRALIEPKVAERLRRHTFYLDGRLTEISAE